MQQAPVIVFDRADDLHHGWLRTRGVDPDQLTVHRIPAASDIVAGARLGLGWAMVPLLQESDPLAEAVVPLDRRSSVAVVLHWQQWRLRSPSLDALADAVRAGARKLLEPVGRGRRREGDAGPQVRPGI